MTQKQIEHDKIVTNEYLRTIKAQQVVTSNPKAFNKNGLAKSRFDEMQKPKLNPNNFNSQTVTQGGAMAS